MATLPGRVFIFLLGAFFVGPYIYAMLAAPLGGLMFSQPPGEALPRAWRKRRALKAGKKA